jgi:hypothetical protein
VGQIQLSLKNPEDEGYPDPVQLQPQFQAGNLEQELHQKCLSDIDWLDLVAGDLSPRHKKRPSLLPCLSQQSTTALLIWT